VRLALTNRRQEVRVPIDANRAVVHRFIEGVLGRGDFAVLSTLATPDCTDDAAHSPAAIPHFLATWRAAFPDLRVEIDELVAAGDCVTARWTLCGTHRGAFLGLAPTGQRVAVAGRELYRMASGKVVQRCAAVDTPGLQRQLGAPPPAIPTGRPAGRARA
jgi:predicted ester cyclase